MIERRRLTGSPRPRPLLRALFGGALLALLARAFNTWLGDLIVVSSLEILPVAAALAGLWWGPWGTLAYAGTQLAATALGHADALAAYLAARPERCWSCFLFDDGPGALTAVERFQLLGLPATSLLVGLLVYLAMVLTPSFGRGVPTYATLLAINAAALGSGVSAAALAALHPEALGMRGLLAIALATMASIVLLVPPLTILLARPLLRFMVPLEGEPVPPPWVEGLVVTEMARRLREPRNRMPSTLALAALAVVTIVVLSVHASAAGWDVGWEVVYVIPPVLAALVFGMRGGVLGASLVAVLALGYRAFYTADSAILPDDATLDAVRQGMIHLVNASLAGLLGASIDRVERLQRELRRQRDTDPLTGLRRRERGELELQRLLTRSSRERFPVAVVLLDLDHFKAVNDSYGHASGDAVLAAVGEILGGSRPEDVVWRHGGEEIGAALVADCEGAVSWAERMLAMVRRQAAKMASRRLEAMGATPLPPEVWISFSAGVAVFPRDGQEPSDLIAAADAALYRAKEAGRARVEMAGLRC